jgi:catechol 2,3-dioxygenase-like lactoylglutathione lyase family enzyme
MINGVVDFYYNTTNMEAATRFYTEALGMKLIHASEFWTELDTGGYRVGLHAVEQPLVYVPRDSHGPYAGGTLTLRSSNIKEDRTHLERYGAKILGENDAPWGHMLVFEDGDGNVLKLMKPK